MALSTISLTPGMRANLFSLQQTSKDFEIVQKRLATGLRRPGRTQRRHV
jgi:hypothetical protein